jgi:hypothetical protein
MPGFYIPISNECHDENYSLAGGTTFVGPAHTLETVRTHRYRISIIDTITSEIQLLAYKCTRPTPEIDKIVIHNAQNEISRPGKHRWKPVEFTFYEILEKDGGYSEVAYYMYRWWSRKTLNIDQSLHLPPSEYLKECWIETLDGIGDSVWEYRLQETWPSKISPSNLTYTSSEIADIGVTLEYQLAIETSP